MKASLTLNIRKSIFEKLVFAKSTFLDLAKLNSFNLTKFDFSESANFTIVDKFWISLLISILQS